MKISLCCIGKNEDNEMTRVVRQYEKRLRHYVPFEVIVAGKSRLRGTVTPERQIENEAEVLLRWIEGADFAVLLDEKGREMASGEFSQFIQLVMNRGVRHLAFLIGGAYGFSDRVYQAAHDKVSLSRLTYSHQLARLVFVEQLYRAMTILQGEPYHHI